MSTYSFLSVTGSINGPGGSINIGTGSGISDEGVDWAPINDVNTMITGADGAGMHSLSAARSGMLTVAVLKTSKLNSQLQTMYNLQTSSPFLHGKNVITFRDVARGDSLTCLDVAFKNQPPIKWAKDANFNLWSFDVIAGVLILGDGNPSIL